MSTAYHLGDDKNTALGTRYSRGRGNGTGLRMDLTKEEWDAVVDLRLPVYSERGEKFASPRWWMKEMTDITNNQVEFQTADSIKRDIDYYNGHRFGPIFARHKEELRKRLAQKLKTDSPPVKD